MALIRILFDDTYRPAYRQVSRVVGVSGLWFSCGQLDTNGDGVVQSPGDAIEQTRRVKQRINNLLAHCGADLDSAIKVNAYHRGESDLQTWTRTVQARCDFYPSPGPASTGVEVAHVGLDDAALVVDCIAVKQ